MSDTMNPTDAETEGDDDRKRTSQLSDQAVLSRLKKQFKADWNHSKDWRDQARKDFDFVAGDQWDAKDRAALDDMGRPVITFNRTLAIVKAVAGIEINSRHETVFLPRGTSPGSVKANELLTGASQWMSDETDAEDEQSEAFQDCITCGMGWTDSTISYDENPDGGYVEDRTDPLEMVWDKGAKKKNLKDARRLFRIQKISRAEARDLAREHGWDGEDDTDLHAAWAMSSGDTQEAKPVEERRLREGNTDGHDDEEIQLVHAQWIEREPYWRVAGPQGIVEVNEAQYKQLQAMAKQSGVELTSTRAHRKVYKQALLGNVILGKVRPGLVKDRFTFQCITGESHRNKRTWFGLISMMRDPQMWANKWLSQTLHILNTTAKGGIIAETDAFEDTQEAQRTYAQPDAITFAAKDAIAKGKIMQKPGAGMPAGYINLLEFAISSIRDVTGINMELLGMRDANQPGVLEAQRKQAAMTILATLFDSLRRYRRNVGRVRLGIIQNYLSDDRLIRLSQQDGEGAFKVVQLAKDHVAGSFEVIVDDSPTSPNQKQETWGVITQVLPVFREMLTPESVMVILEYSPLPSKLVDAFKAMASQPDPEADERKKLAEAAAKAKVARDVAAASKDQATADKTKLDGLLDLIMAGAAIPVPTAPPMAAAPMPGQMLPGEQFAIAPPEDTGRGLPQLPQLPVGPPPPVADPAAASAPDFGLTLNNQQ